MLVLISFISRKGSALRQHRSQLCEEQKDTLLRQRSKKKEKDVKIVCILPSSHVGRTLNVAAIRFPKIFAHFTGWIGENRARQLSSCGSGYRSPRQVSALQVQPEDEIIGGYCFIQWCTMRRTSSPNTSPLIVRRRKVAIVMIRRKRMSARASAIE